MSRKYYFGALLALGAVIFGPLSAKTSSAQTSEVKNVGSARVQHVAVRGTGDATEVEIQTSGTAVAPDTQAVSDPDRIIVDFPGALPAAALHAFELKVNSAGLKSIRAGLFFNNPPITRIVLDLAEPHSYHILTGPNATIVKLGPAPSTSAEAATAKSGAVKIGSAKLNSAVASSKQSTVAAFRPEASGVSIARTPRLQNALMAGGERVVPAQVSAMPVVAVPPPAPAPPVAVTFVGGMLRIHADKATLAQVLYEVKMKTQAEIAIPAGAEQEEVIADIGPAPPREVLASLLNGSSYNFIFVGNESTLDRVILTRRDPNIF